MIDPKIYLAIDNCFASKRWTRPAEWIKLIKSLGVNYIEASADNECDPLYTTPDYLNTWTEDVRSNCEKYGIKVANLYSGHGTYSTLGLAHTDKGVAERMQNDWIKPMAAMASELQAGLGFFCHAFSYPVLQEPDAYKAAELDLYRKLADISAYCGNCCVTAGVEQMYSPHQIPWTIMGAVRLLQTVYRLSGHPFYITIDTGHQTGQCRYLKPEPDTIREAAWKAGNGKKAQTLWLGPQSASLLFNEMLAGSVSKDERFIDAIREEMDRYPYLFAEYMDGDPYAWLENLGCYSPIIHLQQTNGIASAHWPFDDAHNRNGIIHADEILRAISVAYGKPGLDAMPPKCGEICLTLEIFSGTAEFYGDILDKITNSVKYWRQYVPQDGMRLSEILEFCHRRT